MNVQLGNIEMSIHALDVAFEIGCECFLATGIVAEYAFCDNVMNVNARQTPNDMYGAAKVAAYYLLEVRARQLQISFVWAVIPSTFGEGRKDNIIWC